MFTRICRTGVACLLLAGCAVSLLSEDRVEVGVNGQDVVVAAPDGLCIDPRSVDVTRAGAFMLMGDCAALGGESARAVNAVVTASVSTGGLPGTLDDLQGFLTGPGVVTLSKSGELEKVSALTTRIVDDILFIKVRDEGRPAVPGATQEFWRGFFEVSGRLIGASVVGFDTAPISDAQARGLIGSLAVRTRAANAAPVEAPSEI